MWIIGFVLLAGAIVVGVDIWLMNDQQVDFEAFNEVWTSNPATVFLVGVATTLVGALGLWLLYTGLRRSRVRRRDRRAFTAERERLADERQREIDAMSAAGAGYGTEQDQTTGDRTMVSDTSSDRSPDYGDGDRDRERISDDDREPVDLRDEQEAEHHERRGVMHRSDR